MAKATINVPDGYKVERFEVSSNYSSSVHNRELGRAGKPRVTGQGKPCLFTQVEVLNPDGTRFVGNVNLVTPKGS